MEMVFVNDGFYYGELEGNWLNDQNPVVLKMLTSCFM